MKARLNAGMLSFAAAARRVDRAPGTLLRWIELGEFPQPIVLNKRRYYYPQQIDGWIAQTYAAAGIDPNSNGGPASA